MSFSKAKIKRFNERGSEAPPPGAYDPKFESNVKSVTLEKKERFPDNRSVCSSGAESHVSTASKTSNSHIDKIKNQAQLLVKKRVIAKPQFMNNTKSKLHKSPKSPKVTSRLLTIHNAKYQISDLKVNCANKQKTIEECEEKIRQLEVDIELQKKRELDMQEQHQKELQTMENDHKEILKAYEDKFTDINSKLPELQEQIIQLQCTKDKELSNIKVEKDEIINLFKKYISLIPSDPNLDYKNLDHLQDQKKQIMSQMDKLELDMKDFTVDNNIRKELHRNLQTTFAFYLNCFDVLIKSSEFYRSEYEFNDLLESEYLLKENEELRQQLEFESIANQELQKNLRNIKTDKEVLKKQLENVKKLFEESKQRLHLCQNEVEELKQLLKKELEKMQSLFQNTKGKFAEEIRLRGKAFEDLENMYITREKELAEVKKSMSMKVEEVKKHADKMIKNAEAVTRETLAACRNESEEKVKKIIAETDTKVNVMVQEARNTANEEMRTAVDKLKRIESEKEALEQKLSEKDTEINWLTSALEELKTSAETQESFSQSLQAELDRVETELAEKKGELRSLKDKIRSESAEMVARRQRFDVVMAENQASINALMQRLAQSDAEVERLQRELQNGKVCMHEHRDLLNVMCNSSKLAKEQVFALMEKLEFKISHIDQVEIKNLADIEAMRIMFEQKIDNLKQIIVREVERLEEECRKKDVQNKELKQQLEQMTNKLKESQDLLLKLEEINDENEIKLSKLQLTNSKFERILKEKQEIINNRELKTIDQYESKIEQANKKISALAECLDNMQKTISILQKECASLESEKLNYVKNEQQLKESLEKEINRRLKLDEQVNTLSETCERYKEEYQEISEKYSEILGHNNMKQRVKHVSQLKDKICAQQSEILRLKQELELKNKNIDLLKSNEKRVYSKGKENVQNSANTSKKSTLNRQTSTPLTKSANSTVVSSSSPHGPLRHRNE